MATQIGTIKTVVGTVTALMPDGQQRNLQQNDVVFQNELVQTSEFGAVEILLNDGSIVDLGRNSEISLDPSTMSPETPLDDITAIQQAILDGEDPTQSNDPTAAGPEIIESDEGTNIVQVQHLAPETTPTSGFDTTGIDFAFQQDIEPLGDDLPTPSSDDDNPINTPPSTGVNSPIALDDDTLGGNPGGISDNSPDSLNLTGTLTHNYGTAGPGSILLSGIGAPAGFVYNLSNGGQTLTIQQNNINILEINLSDPVSGNYTITQLAPASHEQGQDENDQPFTIPYVVTDANGNTATGNININLDDDTPTITIDQDSVNDTAYSFTVTNHPEVSSAGYNSSYGYYIKDANGNPTTGVIIWDNVKDADATTATVSGQFSPDQVGFFIIPNGDRQNSSLTDNTEVTFEFVNGQWQAFSNGQALNGSGAPALFDNANLNSDNQDHVQDNALTGNQNWEDLPIRTGDGDYNDVNVNVVWTSVNATGDSIDSMSFGADGPKLGADGPGGIDFTLEEVNIMGTLTSNGKEVTFEARDTNNDGQNDLVVGKTEDGDVLTIDGILEPGQFELELFAPLDSSNNGNNDVEITTNLSLTDSDGDSIFATLNFNLDINQITETTASTTADA